MLKKVDESTWLLLDENGTVLDEPDDSCPCKGFSQYSLFEEAGMDYYEFPFDEVETADEATARPDAMNSGTPDAENGVDEVGDDELDAAAAAAEAKAAEEAAPDKTDNTTRAPVVDLDLLRVRRKVNGDIGTIRTRDGSKYSQIPANKARAAGVQVRLQVCQAHC